MPNFFCYIKPSMKLKKHHILSIGFVILLYLYLNLNLIFTKPAIWPDEAVYFDTAYNFITQGRLATDMWQGLVPGVEKMALWNPPAFFLLLSYWLKITGFTLFNQRLLSVFAGGLSLIFLYILSGSLSKHKWSGLLASLIVISDFHFLRATRISRPEIFVILFFLISLNLLLIPKIFKKEKLQFFLSGLFISLAVLTHPLSIFYTFFYAVYFYIHKKTLDLNHIKLLLLGFIAPIAIWLLSISSYWSILYTQMSLASFKKFSETTWLLLTLNGQNSNLKVLYFILICTTLFIFHFLYKHKKNKELIIASILLIISWFMALYGRMFWYYTYISPFIGLSAAIVLSVIKPKKFFQLPLVISAFVLINTIYTIDDFSKIKSANPSYKSFTKEILANIPDQTTVYLSSTPDPYYGFFESGRTNKIIEFPVYPLDKKAYIEVLNKADFIVTTGNMEELILGSLFPDYIKLNKQSEVIVGKNSGYEATVIKLIAKEQRTSPIIGNP